MQVTFYLEKAIQATGLLLRLAGGRASKMRVLKLLYIAERESLKASGRPICGGRLVAMDYGPLNSQILSAIQGDAQDLYSEWDSYFDNDSHDIVLKKDPGLGKLTKFEVATLREIHSRMAGWSDGQIVDFCHTLTEYRKNEPPEGSRREITWEDMLDALDMSRAAEAVQEEIFAKSAAECFLSSVTN